MIAVGVVADESQLEGIVMDDKKQIIEQHPNYSNIPAEGPASWSSSLIKAVQVGSKLGDSQQLFDESESENENDEIMLRKIPHSIPNSLRVVIGEQWDVTTRGNGLIVLTET